MGKKVFSVFRDVGLYSGERSEEKGTFLFSMVDNSIEFETQIDSYELRKDWKEIFLRILKNLLFSLNEKEIFEEREIEKYIDLSLEYLGLDKSVSDQT